MSSFPRLLEYARPYRVRFAVALLAMLLYAAASAGLATLIQPLIDNVLPSRANLGLWGLTVLTIYLLKGLGAYLSTYLMTDIGQRVVRDLRIRLFRHILDQSAAFFGRQTSGRLMSRITSDVNQVQQAVSETIGDLLREGLALVGYGAYLFYVDYKLAMVVVTGAPVVVYPLVRLGQRIRRTTRRSQEELEQLSHVTAEAFTGHRIVKAFGAETHEAGRFRRAAERLYRTTLKVTSTVAVLPPLMEFLGGVAVVGLIWYGSREIATGRLSEGDFVGFVVAAFLMYGPIKRLSRVNTTLQQAIAASDRIFEMLDTHTEVVERPGARRLAPLRRSIEFRHVGFEYESEPGAAALEQAAGEADGAAQGSRHVLRDVSFEVEAGQMVALVGLSGAGKTTLVNLIPRFYDVSSGVILIDGVDIRDVTLTSLRANVGIVTQETILFDDTVANNIAYGSPQATPAEIEEAARAAHAHDFVVTLPQQYDTSIGERGQRLSGGQRQRLAIARALLKNAPILILDEATSSLDAESERLVQEALTNLMRNRTAFVIAHRLSTVRRADKIVTLERGRVVEIGRHEDLVARPGGVYARLYSLQLFERGGREPGADGDGDPDVAAQTAAGKISRP
ncbi:MAG TPA: ABC transporter transmembrane domain-containing protein [Vicinamibacterales bacterium]|nr:ABC transporter transmembrane domain-containing protein [Vicinamibacterales bacterium]